MTQSSDSHIKGGYKKWLENAFKKYSLKWTQEVVLSEISQKLVLSQSIPTKGDHTKVALRNPHFL